MAYEANIPKKSNKSAIVLIPSQDVWSPIQTIRSVHDKSFNRWMPHINLLYPFLEDDKDGKNFEFACCEIKSMLEKSSFEPFGVVFDQTSFQHFEHKSNCTMWLEPKDKSGNKNHKEIINIQKALEEIFPDFDDLSRISPDNGFTPHLSLGSFNKKDVENSKAVFRESWEPIEFEIKEINIISRKNFDSPFEVRHRIALM